MATVWRWPIWPVSRSAPHEVIADTSPAAGRSPAGKLGRLVRFQSAYTGAFAVATTNDLKNGMVLNLDNELWAVVEFQHVKPGKGPAFVRTTLKHVLSGKVVDK